MAQLLLNVLMAFAQFERQMIAERIRDKVVAARRKGLWTGGNVPFGYRNEGRKLLPEPDEARVVRYMVEVYEREASDCALARELAARALTTRKGRTWKPQAVARVLTNPIYAGYVTLGDERHAAEHEPLIARERFERLQELRAAKDGPGCHGAHAKRQRNPEYLLRGLLFCACTHHDGSTCGYSMTPSSTRKGNKSYRFYRCIARDKVAVGACPARPLAAKDLEHLVRRQVVEVAQRLDEQGRDAGSTVDAAVARHAGRRITDLKERRQELRRKLGERALELDALDAEVGATDRAASAYVAKRRAERERLRAELHAVQTQLGLLEQLVLSRAWIAEQLRGLDQVWERLLPINRLRVIRAVVERVDVDSASGDVRLTLKHWVSEALAGKEHGHAA
jgi:site-specific DNA recombinase